MTAMHRATPPPRAEVKELCAELGSVNITVPRTAQRALDLADKVERLAQPPDIAGSVANLDLSRVSEQKLLTIWQDSVVRLSLSTPAGRSLLRELLESLTAAAVTELADDLPRMLSELADIPAREGVGELIEAAKSAGLTSTSTADDAVRLGPGASGVWRDLQHALRIADGTYELRTRLISITGGEVSPCPQL